MRITREELMRLLREDPTLIEELRMLLLTKELLELPARTSERFNQMTSMLQDLINIVRQILDTLNLVAQQTLENSRQIAVLIEQGREHDRRLAELTEQVREHDRRLAELTEQVRENGRQIAALIEQGRRHDEQIAALIEQGRQHQERLARLEEQFARAMPRLDRVYGWALENQYRDRPFAYFSRIVRRARWISGDELEDLLDEAVKAGHINEAERDEIIWADLIVRGTRQGQPTWLVVEVSGTIGYEDIDRALERRDLFARCVDAPVLAAVAGEYCTEEVLKEALTQGVWVLLNGHTYSPEMRE